MNINTLTQNTTQAKESQDEHTYTHVRMYTCINIDATKRRFSLLEKRKFCKYVE